MPTEFEQQALDTSQRKLGSAMVRWGLAGLLVPDPIPFVDEILFGSVVLVGGILYGVTYLPSGGGITVPDTYSPPKTSTTRTLSRGGNVKKQISSTSHFYSRRKKYDYGKRKRYNRY